MTIGELAHFGLRYAHITGGLVALGAGAGAMIYKKGSPMHKQHGHLFFVAMMTMAGTGLYGALFINPVAANVNGAMMALYLTFTAWLTMWREPGKTGRLEIVGALWGLAAAAAAATFGFRAMESPRRVYEEFPATGYFVFATVALIGSALDARMIALGGFTGASRLHRHLARMCLALFMATGSFFLGQARQFPPEIRQSGLLMIPAMAPIVLLPYWLIRIRVWPSIRNAWSTWMSQRTAAHLP
jgi:hypothetical protein